MIIHNPILTGSFSVNGADLSTITGSVATSASFDARTTYLESTSSILTAASASQSVTSGSLVAASASLSATSGSLSAASGSFNTRVSALEATGSALSSSLLTVSGSGYATSGSLNTRVSALEVTGSALSSSLLTVSGSGYATSASLSAASGSFNSRVATIESKYATTGSNTFIDTQVVSGSILQSGSFTSTGTLTAQTLVIQTITSSVVYSSGSNVFGNSLGNSQVFTGSVLITGSLTIAGASSATSYSGVTIYGSTVVCSPVGKFTSCIDAGSGTFSSSVTATSLYATVGSVSITQDGTYGSNYGMIGFGGTTNGSNRIFAGVGTYDGLYLASATGKNIEFRPAGTFAMTILSTGSVGIGTNIPSQLLHLETTLASSSGVGTAIQITSGGAGGDQAWIGVNKGTGNGLEFSVENRDIIFNTGTTTPFGGTERMRITCTGNVGLGVTPSNAYADSRTFEIGAGGILWSEQTPSVYNSMSIGSNFYYNAAGSLLYKNAAVAASRFTQYQGSHIWYTAGVAPSAGAAITFTQAMTLDANGDLQIGTTTTSGERLTVYGSSEGAVIFQNSTSGTGSANGLYLGVLNSENYLWTYENQPIIFGTSNGEKMRLDASGNLGLGVTASAWSGITALQIGGYASFGGDSSFVTYVSSNAYYNAGWKYIGVSAAANYYQDAGGHYFRSTSTTGTAGGAITWITPLTIASTGAATFSSSVTAGDQIRVTGTTANALYLYGAATVKPYITINEFGVRDWKIGAGTTSSGKLSITATLAGTDGITIDGFGNVGVGTSSSGNTSSARGLVSVNGSSTSMYELQVGGSEYGYVYHGGSNGNMYFNNSRSNATTYVISYNNGVYLGTSATSWTSNSDERLKNITGNIENAIDSLSTLRTIKHTWKSDNTNKEHLALIAQDVEKVFPQVIDKNKLPSKSNENQTDETEYLGVRYTELVPVLVKAIQELNTKFEEYKTTHP